MAKVYLKVSWLLTLVGIVLLVSSVVLVPDNRVLGDSGAGGGGKALLTCQGLPCDQKCYEVLTPPNCRDGACRKGGAANCDTCTCTDFGDMSYCAG